MLKKNFANSGLEAGCDEAGRGCLAGPVVAAAVIFPHDFDNDLLNDSKKLTEYQREKLRIVIEQNAVAWAVACVDNCKIDEINILNASFLAMHLALDQLAVKPALILVDGNRFLPYPNILHKCIVGGDGKFMSIAAASILAKTHRDDYMRRIDAEFPHYNWKQNKGYPTIEHRKAVMDFGKTPYHRLSFKINFQLRMNI